MNHLKAYALRNGCDAFMTYADHGAVGYFEKQGFTTELSLPKERYDGYVKVGRDGRRGCKGIRRGRCCEGNQKEEKPR